jgi:hypothetical protein
MRLELSTYLMHRVGAMVGFSGGCLFFAFLTENQAILNGPVGKAYIFLVWGLFVVIAPLIMVLPKRDSAVFILLNLPLVGACGIVVFVLPEGVWPHVWVILMLGFVLALVLLTKSRKFRFLDLQPKVSPYMFAESLLIFAISWVCAFALQFIGFVLSFNGSSPIAVNLFIWTVLFVITSLVATAVHIARHR